jgi:outer membrane receptor protein involved in Fe transport
MTFKWITKTTPASMTSSLHTTSRDPVVIDSGIVTNEGPNTIVFGDVTIRSGDTLTIHPDGRYEITRSISND